MERRKETHSIHPFRKVVAGLESGTHLGRVHRLVLLQVLGVLPLKELLATLSIWVTTEMAVGRSHLVFRLAKSQRHSECTGAGIELHLNNIRDVLCREFALFRAISLHE